MKTFIKLGYSWRSQRNWTRNYLKNPNRSTPFNDSIIVIYSPVGIIDYYLNILELNMSYNIINSSSHAKIGQVNLIPIKQFRIFL